MAAKTAPEGLDDATLSFSKPVTVRNGTTFIIDEMTLFELGVVVRLMKPFKASLDKGIGLESILIEEFDTCLPVIESLTGVSKDALEGLHLSDVSRLVEAALEVNTDFFVQQVIPLIPRVLGRLQAKVVGLSQSISSSVPDTDAPKSSA
jgi:hypothetical protein